MNSGRIALVLGATRGIGGETALALSPHGWKSRALSRAGQGAVDAQGWDWVMIAVVTTLRGLGCLTEGAAFAAS